jgi:SAM-dependent methyltransferase
MQRKDNECPVCGNICACNIKPIERIESILRLQCLFCGAEYFSSDNYAPPVYDLTYNSHFYRPTDIKKAGIRACEIASILDHTGVKGDLLDIGVGNGLTQLLLCTMGLNCFGIDIDPELCRFLYDRFGLTMFAGRFEDFNPNFKLGFLHASHVIEHCQDPMLFLKHAKLLLDKQGLFLLDTPDLGQNHAGDINWKHYKTRNPLEHCCLFREGTLRFAANKAGFDVVWIRQNTTYQNLELLLQARKGD